MLDLIGFWGNVSLITFTMLLPFLAFVFPFLAEHFTKAVTEDEGLSQKAKDFFCKIEWRNTNYFVIFRKLRLHEGFVILGSITGILGIIGLTIRYLGEDKSFISGVAQISEITAPYTAWFVLAFLVYYGAIFLMRKAYSTYQKVEKIFDKVSGDK